MSYDTADTSLWTVFELDPLKQYVSYSSVKMYSRMLFSESPLTHLSLVNFDMHTELIRAPFSATSRTLLFFRRILYLFFLYFISDLNFYLFFREILLTYFTYLF